MQDDSLITNVHHKQMQLCKLVTTVHAGWQLAALLCTVQLVPPPLRRVMLLTACLPACSHRASAVSLDGSAGVKQEAVRAKRQELKVEPSFKRVDTCAAEFEAATPYMYSSYDGECESMPTDKPKVLILGGGPNRIGQGIEFDYCCCHASFALR